MRLYHRFNAISKIATHFAFGFPVRHIHSRLPSRDAFHLQTTKSLVVNSTKPPLCLPTVKKSWGLEEIIPDETQRELLLRALSARNVSKKDFLRWRNAFLALDLEEALQDLSMHINGTPPAKDAVLTDGDPAEAQPLRIPTWLVFCILDPRKVCSPAQAVLGLSLASGQMQHTPRILRVHLAQLLLDVILHHRVTPLLRHAVSLFLTLPSFKPQIHHFNDVFKTITAFPPSSETYIQTLRLLNVIWARGIKVDNRTTRTVLQQKALSRRLIRYILARMKSDSLSPKDEELRALLSASADAGNPSDAAIYLDTLRKLALDRPSTSHVSLASSSNVGDNRDTITEDSLLYLKSFKRGRSVPASFSNHFEHLLHVSRSPKPEESLRSWSRRRVAAWTTYLSVVSRSKGTSLRKIYSYFERARNDGVALNIASYSAVLDGLLLKKDYKSALEVWNEFLRDENIKNMDKRCITAGVRTLAASRLYVDAFTLLDEGFRISRRNLDVVTLNAFLRYLSSSNSPQHPEVIHKIWDAMYTLYGLHPDDRTLDVLMDAATSRQLEGSSEGILDILGLSKANIFGFGGPKKARPFHPTPERPADPNVEAASTQTIVKMLSRAESPSSATRLIWSSLRSPLSGTRWRDRAIYLFREEIIYGNWPELRNLAVEDVLGGRVDRFAFLRNRKSQDKEREGPLWDTLVPDQLLRLKGVSSSTGLSLPLSHAGSDPAARVGLYPHIVPTARSFHSYVSLLSKLGEPSTEIPLTLAWMRALKIPPFRKTLTLALMSFAETGGSWIQGKEDGEYGRLKGWIEGWVGKKACPGDKDVADLRESIWRRREGGRW
jgi:hypothetical protein